MSNKIKTNFMNTNVNNNVKNLLNKDIKIIKDNKVFINSTLINYLSEDKLVKLYNLNKILLFK